MLINPSLQAREKPIITNYQDLSPAGKSPGEIPRPEGRG